MRRASVVPSIGGDRDAGEHRIERRRLVDDAAEQLSGWRPGTWPWWRPTPAGDRRSISAETPVISIRPMQMKP